MHILLQFADLTSRKLSSTSVNWELEKTGRTSSQAKSRGLFFRSNVICRYKEAVGKFAVHPLNQRKIPIVADAQLVDMEFGTGAVKITPAHDPNDFETGKRHSLEFINILTDDGRLNHQGGQFQGLPRFQVCKEFCCCLQDDLKGSAVVCKGTKAMLIICSSLGHESHNV